MADKTWILDIDGVLNPIEVKPPSHIWKSSSWVEADSTDPGSGKCYPIKIATEVIEFVNEMHSRKNVQIVWHTTWQQGANDLAEVFGLPELGVLAAPEFETWNHVRGQGWWKRPAVERFLFANNRDVLWTDDDLMIVHPLPEHRPGFKLKMIAPSPFAGLTRGHLRQIREFLEEE